MNLNYYNKTFTDIEKAYIRKLINSKQNLLNREGYNIFIYNEDSALLCDKIQNEIVIKDFVLARTITLN